MTTSVLTGEHSVAFTACKDYCISILAGTFSHHIFFSSPLLHHPLYHVPPFLPQSYKHPEPCYHFNERPSKQHSILQTFTPRTRIVGRGSIKWRAGGERIGVKGQDEEERQTNRCWNVLADAPLMDKTSLPTFHTL